MDEYVLESHITEATRITENHESLIDIILSNMKNVRGAGCINYSLSDHFPVYLVKKRVRPNLIKEKVYTRSYRNFDQDLFGLLLIEHDWSDVFRKEDVNEIWCIIKDTILGITNDMCPYVWKTVRNDKPFWFNSYLREIAMHRDRLFRNYRRGGKKNKELHKQAVAKCRSFNKACKEARRNFYKEQLIKNCKDQKKIWQVIDE